MLYFVLHILGAISIENEYLYTFGTQMPKNTKGSHSHRTISLQPPYGSHAISVHGCGDSRMTTRSPPGLSMALHHFVIETRQRNRTMAV